MSRITVVAFLIASVVTLALVSTKIRGADEIEYFSLLRSAVFDRDLDFTNEYAHFHAQNPQGLAAFKETFLDRREPKTGRPINFAPIGSAVVWSPFYLGAHLLVTNGVIRGPAVGFGPSYTGAVAYGSSFLAIMGFLLALLYTGNDPLHLEGGDDVFNDHTAVITDISTWIKPFWSYKVERGTKSKDYSRSPMLTLSYRKGWGEDYDPFDLVRAQFDAKATIGAGSVLSMRIADGMFVGDNTPKYFHDFAHYPGSQMIGAPNNSVGAFRILDYYLYSTNDQFTYGLFNYQFRRFGLTQFDYFRRQGNRENVQP